jgi:hypothetical protein
VARCPSAAKAADKFGALTARLKPRPFKAESVIAAVEPHRHPKSNSKSSVSAFRKKRPTDPTVFAKFVLIAALS